MRRKTITILGTIALAWTTLSGTGAHAEPPDLNTIKNQVNKAIPGTPVHAVRPVEGIPGLYELQTGKNIIYSDKDGTRIFIGAMINTHTQVNETAARMQEIAKGRFRDIDDALTIHLFGAGDGDPIVFVDPAQEESRRALKSIFAKQARSRVMLFPLTLVNADSAATATAIWCSRDRAAALRQSAEGNLLAQKRKGCMAPLDAWRLVGSDIGLEGTPSLMTPDGSLAKIPR